MVIRTRRVEGAHDRQSTRSAAHQPPTRAPSKLREEAIRSALVRTPIGITLALQPHSKELRRTPRACNVCAMHAAQRLADCAPSPRLLVVPASCIHQRQGDGGSFSLHAPAPSDVVVVRLRLGLNGRDGGRRGGGGGGRAVGRQPRRRRALAVEHQRHHAANECKGQRGQGDH